MSDCIDSQISNTIAATAAPASQDRAEVPTSLPANPPPAEENTAITLSPQATPPSELNGMSHNVSQCPTFPSFFLIQTPKPVPAPPNPEDLPQYEPATPPAEGEALSPQQQQAIHLLLQGLSDAAVARRLGLNRKTIHRWKWFTPLFYNTLDEAQRQAWNEAYGLLRSSILQSAHTLNHVLKKGKPQQALQAARILLSNAVLTRLEG